MQLAELTDEQLIKAFLRGDETAFEQLVVRYEQKVFQLAYRLSGNIDDASDLAQESFVKVYRHLGKWQGKAAFSTWLYRTVTNTFLDEMRKRKRRPQVAIFLDAPISTEDGHVMPEIPSQQSGPEADYLQGELQRTVWEAMAELSLEHQVVLTLRDIEGHTYEEIATITDVNLGTVKSRISRARVALRQKLSDMEQYEPLRRHK